MKRRGKERKTSYGNSRAKTNLRLLKGIKVSAFRQQEVIY